MYLKAACATLVAGGDQTLMPGDVIYTGTVAPQTLEGKRKQLRPGDVVEVEIENIGVLRNRIVAMKGVTTASVHL